jgi:hypothetical protein
LFDAAKVKVKGVSVYTVIDVQGENNIKSLGVYTVMDVHDENNIKSLGVYTIIDLSTSLTQIGLLLTQRLSLNNLSRFVYLSTFNVTNLLDILTLPARKSFLDIVFIAL